MAHGGAGRARLAAAPAGRDQRHHRRQAHGPARRNIGAVDVALTPEDLAALDAVSALAKEYPGWMLERQGGYRAIPPTR